MIRSIDVNDVKSVISRDKSVLITGGADFIGSYLDEMM